jgi:pyruvate dehydrogenase kinase 2/3/4
VYEKDNGSNLDHFTETLNMIRRRHLDTVPTMAQAVFKLNSINTSEGVTDTVQYFLDRLYTNRLVNLESFRPFSVLSYRISIHMLVSHYNALLGEDVTLTGRVGTLDQKCDILGVCEDAFDAAAVMCDQEYFDHPKLKATAMDTSDENKATQENVTATYVPSHLHHILFEIFKVSFMIFFFLTNLVFLV